MHVSQDQFNELFSKGISEEERINVTEHILECESCANRFRMLNQLQLKMQKSSPWGKRLKYSLGAAAVILMAFTPYLYRGPEMVPQPQGTELAGVSLQPVSDLAVLSQVKTINFRDAMAQWGQRTNLTELVALQNQL